MGKIAPTSYSERQQDTLQKYWKKMLIKKTINYDTKSLILKDVIKQNLLTNIFEIFDIFIFLESTHQDGHFGTNN